MSFIQAMDAAREGRFVTCSALSKGWFVWGDKRGLFAHNPFHGSGPSDRDHAFSASDSMRAAKWRFR